MSGIRNINDMSLGYGRHVDLLLLIGNMKKAEEEKRNKMAQQDSKGNFGESNHGQERIMNEVSNNYVINNAHNFVQENMKTTMKEKSNGIPQKNQVEKNACKALQCTKKGKCSLESSLSESNSQKNEMNYMSYYRGNYGH